MPKTNRAPYFHQDGGKMELRIPLDRKKRSFVHKVHKATHDRDHWLAGVLAIFANGIIHQCLEEGFIADIIDYAGMDEKATLKALRRFQKLGWITESKLEAWRKENLE